MAALTIAALVGFAANSLLCRAAIGAGEIDPATFTAIRLVAGAIVLAMIAFISRERGPARARGSWTSAFALFAYAAAFSVAYTRLTAATGALILFAFVQLAMVGAGLARGERPRAIEWVGHATAIAGLVALALPGLAAPDPLGAALMASAGVAWGVYSLRGRGAKDPLAVTADNFVRTIPMVLVLVVPVVLFGAGGVTATARGVALAIGSGALASGVGYSIWYAALPHLPATRAAVVQLTVPAVAAVGGVVVLGEVLTARFVICAAAILGGVALAIAARRR
ncbi:MAG: DMT family transporter [Kofleriaceae bacterium]